MAKEDYLMSKSKIIAAAILLTTVFAVPGISASAKTMTCPACHMAMPTKKTAMMSVPIYSKSDKTVYYCCASCPAGKKAAAYYKAHKHPMPV
jgi:hypothetical protein